MNRSNQQQTRRVKKIRAQGRQAALDGATESLCAYRDLLDVANWKAGYLTGVSELRETCNLPEFLRPQA